MIKRKINYQTFVDFLQEQYYSMHSIQKALWTRISFGFIVRMDNGHGSCFAFPDRN